MLRRTIARTAVAALVLLAGIVSGGSRLAATATTTAQPERCFPETGKCISGLFLEYWNANGGLRQQGLPLTDPFPERSAIDGKVYLVQYFERARFEEHPENRGTSFEVLLGLLGLEQFGAKYPGGAPSLGTGGGRCFPETGQCVRGEFQDYWERNGGLRQQGLPISPEFLERNPTNGQEYRVQYFERARFEYHPENRAPFDVLLGLLGREQFLTKYPSGQPGAGVLLRLDPPEVGFGFREVGTTTEQAVQVTNIGKVSLGFADVQIVGPGAEAFSVRAGSCFGATLPPGGGCALTIYFTPTAPGDYLATLVLATNTGEPAQARLVGLARRSP